MGKKRAEFIICKVIHRKLLRDTSPIYEIHLDKLKTKLCRLFHMPKELTFHLIMELEDAKMIKQISRGREGIKFRIYKSGKSIS